MSQSEIALHQAHRQPKESISFWDYLKRYNSVESIRTEWVAGTVETYTLTNNLSYQRLLGFLFTLFSLFLGKKQLGEVIIAGFPMYLGDDKAAREPDLMIVLSAHRERIKPAYLDGIADIVVEIVSPESGEHDHGIKYIEYETIGIPEYWLIDPIRREADVYVLGEDRHCHRGAQDQHSRIVSTVLPGFALNPGILWQETPPDSQAAVALVEHMMQA
jgi:Uma2 family endonuclease